MGYKKPYSRNQIMLEVLNKKSKDRGFMSWEDMKITIPKEQGRFIEESIIECLEKVNWQSTIL